MYIFSNAREAFLPHLPQGGVAAEIGVNLGDFSRVIIDENRPAELHLIDPWALADAKADYTDNKTQDGETRCQAVLDRFAPEISSGRIKIHRDFSFNVSAGFPDRMFDWIYIDGNHKYEHALKDIELFAPKVKDDGFILGHDYANHDYARSLNFGVVEAVNEFVRTHGYEFIGLTAENFPTFILAKSLAGKRVNSFLADILYHLNPVVKIDGFHARTFHQQLAHFSDGRMRAIIEID